MDKPYYIELIHVISNSAELEVKWKVPGSEVFTNIAQENLLTFRQEGSDSTVPFSVVPESDTPINSPCTRLC